MTTKPMIAFFLGSLFSAVAIADDMPLEDWTIARHEATQPLGGINSVSVKNLFGEIRMRKHAKDEIYLLYNAQRHKDDSIDAELKLKTHGEEMSVEVSYPPHEGEVPDAFNKRRIDLTVFLPARMSARFETDRGFIQSRGLKGHVSAISQRGNISMRVAGSADLETQHGSIDVIFLHTPWGRDSRIESLTGDVQATIARGGAAEVSLSSHGTFTTDYTLEVDLNEDTGFKRGTASIGNGGNALLLKSDRGSISLLSSRIRQSD